MASDLAEFLWNKFLKALEEAEPELHLRIVSHFKAIKRVIKIQSFKRNTFLSTRLCPLLYDLNDAISECRVFAQQRRLISRNSVRFNPLTEFYFVQTMKRRTARIKTRFIGLADVAEEAIEEGGERISKSLPITFPRGEASNVIGFHIYKAKYKEKLLQNNGGLKAIGIVGMGGSGKTTLALEISNAKSVRGEFSTRIFVRLSDITRSNEPEIGRKVVKLVLEALGYDISRLRDTNLDCLLSILSCRLLYRRYLIVLDDVWIIHEFWDSFLKALPVQPGGAVIVTSRLKEVAKKIVGEENLFDIPALDNEDCWQIFVNMVHQERLISVDHHILAKIKEEIKDQFHGLPLAAKTLAKIIPKRILEIFEPNYSLEEYCIPVYMLQEDSNVIIDTHMPECPVLVFIYTKENQLGKELFDTFRSLLNRNQVFNLLEVNPGEELSKVYSNLDRLKLSGLNLANEIQNRLRTIVVGGDAAVNMLLETIDDLRLERPPSIAPMPLGSENDLAFSFGWGKKNSGSDRPSVVSFLKSVEHAKKMKIDSWHILIRMRAPVEGSCDPTPIMLPGSLHAFQHVCNMEGYHTFRGGFWTYFSIGIHAQLEESKKLVYQNQSTSARPGCMRGLFSNITSIICLNLPSFSGGMNPWGIPSTRKIRDRDLIPSYVDDGLLEIVGFRDDLLGLLQLGPSRRGTRIAQAHRIRFEFHKSAWDHTFIKMDGESWKQPLPVDDDTIVIEISHHGQINVLATHDCVSRSVFDPAFPIDFWDEDDSSEEDFSAVEVQRKFGAAPTFRIPDSVDISHLS
ncbi:diacylglycerol kinase 5 isoform X7 [Jatropha curcas]|uniref:diacylglycerol kinase 5 isoform X7 n=1 Tax=Jatropha curcas TaxID=180498 RepID=UPI00189355E5|nr:diacylglycerol kinase 5 isoform X7 [Jatropha curcas]